MALQSTLTSKVRAVLKSSYDVTIEHVEFQSTKDSFEGDVTIIIFPFLKTIKDTPQSIASKIGNYLVDNVDFVEAYNLIKGFLNLTISDIYYLKFIENIHTTLQGIPYKIPPQRGSVMVEYSSPNTNKPLHLGHIRNNLLGFFTSRIFQVTGYKVYKTQIINDKGIHICKSMLAWLKFGKGETPQSSNTKGDKLVGKYYILFDKYYQQQVNKLVAEGVDLKKAKEEAPILLEAQEMLIKWERGDEDIRRLWEEMNKWVYQGFKITYDTIGVDFDKLYYESDTYLLGKDIVAEGLEKGVFFKESDGSVWVDLSEDGLDKKLLLRSDGTSVYMTQDLGTAIKRIQDFPDVTSMIYTVGNEQDYHFKVLFLILKKMGYSWADALCHLSYGMVDLPEGKMKSREGTVVDADDLMADMISQATKISEELGKLEGYTDKEKSELYHTIGLGALKYYILKVDPKKRILFNPKESIDFNGNTGPFIQYAYARIKSILRKAENEDDTRHIAMDITLNSKEKKLIKHLELLPQKINDSAKNISPAEIANYTYDLVKIFNSFYQNISILSASTPELRVFRLQLCKTVAHTIKFNFYLLGINVPERM